MLLSEKLDDATEKILKDRKWFQNLEKIVPVRQFTGKQGSLFAQNFRAFRQARKTIKIYKPDVVVSGSDYNSLFELYLFRFAKQAGSTTIAIQPSLPLGETKIVQRWIDLTNIYERFPGFIPFPPRNVAVHVRKQFGHFLIYWLMPILAGQKPFIGKSSYVLKAGNSGMRDADFQIVFSKKDFELFRKSGVPEEKLRLLSHPFSRQSTNAVFEKLYELGGWPKKASGRSVSIMLPNEITFGFHDKNWQLISRDKREREWQEIVSIIASALPGWKIYIKPHPDGRNLSILKEKFQAISSDVTVADPRSAAEAYTKISDVVVGLPPPASTTLFTALMQSPQKPVLAIDTLKEVIGDYYKDFNGIDYITDKDKLIQTLKLIKTNKYRKGSSVTQLKNFNDAAEMIGSLHKVKQQK
ncbi:MAG: hypothetical protein Q7S32_04025 [bacterium]|nr:hypothetical protein [bacterium]